MKAKLKNKYISIEGCIGSGKTTLAQLLGKEIKAKVLIEATKRHPFIRDFYLNPKDYAFQTEMNFILIHYHQLQKALQDDWFKHVVVSDFLFDKDFLFATLTLGDQKEFKLFKNTFDLFKTRIPTPDLVFYLRAPTKFLYQRIKNRGREFERNIPLVYLENLNKKYDDFFNNYPKKRLVVFDAISLDWRGNKSIAKEKVVNRMLKEISI